MVKKKRLLIATDRFLPRWDGIVRFLDLLIPELTKNFEVTILAPKLPGKIPKYQDVKIIRFPLSGIKFGKLDLAKPKKRKVRRAVKKADLVFVQIVAPIGFLATKYAHQYNKPIVNYVHCIEWDLAAKLIENFQTIVRFIVKQTTKYCYNKSNLLLVPSKQVADLLEKNGIETKKQIVPLGIETNKFLPAASKTSAKKKIGIPSRYKVIGFTGRVGTLEKDLPTLITAFQDVKKKYPKTKLLLVGEVLNKNLPKHKDIIYTGEKANVIPYLQAMDIFVMPSLIETSSLATMEAMSTGCSVVATPVGSIQEYLIEKVNGLIFPKGDAQVLKENLHYLLKNDSQRTKFANQGRQTIIERHEWKKTAKKITEVLMKIK